MRPEAVHATCSPCTCCGNTSAVTSTTGYSPTTPRSDQRGLEPRRSLAETLPVVKVLDDRLRGGGESQQHSSPCAPRLRRMPPNSQSHDRRRRRRPMFGSMTTSRADLRKRNPAPCQSIDSRTWIPLTFRRSSTTCERATIRTEQGSFRKRRGEIKYEMGDAVAMKNFPFRF